MRSENTRPEPERPVTRAGEAGAPASPASLPEPTPLLPLRIAGWYAIVAGLWILLSDRLVERLGLDAETLTLVQTNKGLAFVAVTTLLLGILVHRHARRVRRALAAVGESEARYRSLFENMLEGCAYCRMVFDAQDRPVDFVYLDVNRTFGVLTGLGDVVGRRATEVFPGIRDAHPELLETYGRVARTGRAEGFEIEFKPLSLWLSVSVYSSEPGLFVAVFDNITERKRAEAALVTSEAKYRRLHQTMTDAFVYVDMSGRLLEWNRAYRDLLGYTDDELAQLTYVDLTPARWHEAEARVVAEQIIPNGHSAVYEKEYRRKDGTIFPVELRTFLVRGAAGEPLGMWAIVRDITQRKRAETALRESEERLKLALAASRMGVWEWNLQTQEVFWSPECLAITGVETFGGSLESFTRLVHPEDLERVLREAGEAAADRTHYVSEFRILRGDGTTRWLSNLGRARYDDRGQPVRIVGTVMDITERRQAEEALRRSEAKFRALHENMRDAFAIVDMEGRLREFNSAFQQMLGYPETELRQLTYAQITPARWHEFEARIIREQVRVRGYSEVYEKEYRRRDGTVFPVELRAVLMKDEAGEPVAIWGLVRDITERKRAASALQESEHRFRTLADASFEGIALSERGVLVDVNDQLARMTGYARSELIGRPLSILVAPESRERVAEACTGQAGFYEHLALRRDGTVFPVEVHARLVQREGREVLLSAIRDITERHRREEVLQRSEERLRALAARLQVIREEERISIAREVHDQVGQALTSLNMDVAWLHARLPGPGSAASAEAIEHRLRAMTTLVGETVRAVQRISAELRPGVLDDLGLAAAVEWQTEEFSQRTGIACSALCPPLTRALDRERSTALFRILQELLSNVVRHAQATHVRVELRESQDGIILRVQDDGRGITDSEIQSPRSLGLLGLRERAQAAGGQVEICGESGQGTCVTVRVPVPPA